MLYQAERLWTISSTRVEAHWLISTIAVLWLVYHAWDQRERWKSVRRIEVAEVECAAVRDEWRAMAARPEGPARATEAQARWQAQLDELAAAGEGDSPTATALRNRLSR